MVGAISEHDSGLGLISMTTGSARQGDIRRPQQKRSRKRVEQILDAANSLIAERGSAGMTITEIAELAGITPGSMYQYFPNKAAIINALATRHLEEFSQRLEAELSSLPQSAEEMALAFDALIEADYQTGLADPAVRDIWQGMAVDKALLEMFTAESHRNVAALTEAARPMVREAERDGLAVSISLMFHFADSAIRVALGKPEAQGRADIERIKSMLRLIWFSMV